jgi:NADPH-dependent ferric siderophore reductase
VSAVASERRPFPLCTGVADVVGVRCLTPAMTRVTLGGPALQRFFVEEPGEIITLLWPAPRRELVLPQVGWRFPPGVAEAQHARNYTVRHWRAEARELDIDFVVHGDHGLASRWAARVRPGDRLGFAGPRVHWSDGSRAGEGWTLLVADETGLPALAAIAEQLAPGHRAFALIEVADGDERQTLDTRADLDVQWLHRDGAPAGTTTLLPDAVAALDLTGGPGRVWGGGEALAMRGVRRHVRDERGLPADAVSVLGYWKHRDTESWE